MEDPMLFWHISYEFHMPATGIILPSQSTCLFCGTLEKRNSNSEKHNSKLMFDTRIALKIIPPVHEIHFEVKLETNQRQGPLTSRLSGFGS